MTLFRLLAALYARLLAWLFAAALERGPASDPTDDEVCRVLRLMPAHFYSTIAGNGGGILVNGVVVAGVLTWDAAAAPRNADITSSSTAGSQDSVTVVRGWKGTIKLIMDSDLTPAAAGITQGATVTLALVIGASGRQWGGTARLDGPAIAVDNQNGVVTYSLAWESKPPLWPNP